MNSCIITYIVWSNHERLSYILTNTASSDVLDLFELYYTCFKKRCPCCKMSFLWLDCLERKAFKQKAKTVDNVFLPTTLMSLTAKVAKVNEGASVIKT